MTLNKQQFLQELRSGLKRLPEPELEDIIRDYEEYYSAGQASGKTEEQISAALGSPKKIARELMADYHVGNAAREWSLSNVWKAVRSVSAVDLLNVVLVLGGFALGLVLLVGGWLVSLSLITAPLILWIIHVIEPVWLISFLMFLAVGLSGLGLLLAVLMTSVSGWFSQGFLHYLQFIRAKWKGGDDDAEKA